MLSTAAHGRTGKARRVGHRQGALDHSVGIRPRVVIENTPSGTLALRLRCCWIGTIEGGAQMIRDLFIAFVMLILTVAATAWINSGARLSVQQMEASLAK
jgi:hypothetical protein